MDVWGRITGVFAFSIVVSLMALAVPASAVDMSDGDYWTYDMAMDFDEVALTGSITLTFEDTDELTVGSESYEVNVMRINGSASGSIDLLGSPMEYSMDFGGYSYDSVDGIATVKEDMFMWANVSWGTAPITLSYRVEEEITTAYSPPLLSGYDEETTGVGDSWDETLNMTMTTTTWLNGTIEDTTTDSEQMTYSVAVAADEVDKTVGDNTYSTLRITVIDESGDYEVYWYSEDVGGFVAIYSYSEGETTPYSTLDLTEFEHSTGAARLAIVMIVVGIVVAAVVVAAVLLLVMKRRKTAAAAPPMPIQEQTQVPPPPPPPPGQ